MPACTEPYESLSEANIVRTKSDESLDGATCMCAKPMVFVATVLATAVKLVTFLATVLATVVKPVTFLATVATNEGVRLSATLC